MKKAQNKKTIYRDFLPRPVDKNGQAIATKLKEWNPEKGWRKELVEKYEREDRRGKRKIY